MPEFGTFTVHTVTCYQYQFGVSMACQKAPFMELFWEWTTGHDIENKRLWRTLVLGERTASE